MKTFSIVPAAGVFDSICANTAEDALMGFVLTMDTDLHTYFKAVEEQEGTKAHEMSGVLIHRSIYKEEVCPAIPEGDLYLQLRMLLQNVKEPQVQMVFEDYTIVTKQDLNKVCYEMETQFRREYETAPGQRTWRQNVTEHSEISMCTKGYFMRLKCHPVTIPQNLTNERE